MGSSEPLRAEGPGETLDPSARDRQGNDPFIVVGVGASAGGLEALSELLSNLPENTGMALVIVQHLDPQHETKLSSLLSRVTKLPVMEAEQDLAVRPDHVYVIPRNTTMTIAQGALKLTPRDGSHGLHLPVDLFLKSLAKDRQTSAIGVILSGTGSDGTLGMEEIKAEGGITFAQDESSARYTGMPQSAARSGCVDLLLSPARIARELARIGQHRYVAGEDLTDEEARPTADEDVHYRKILEVLRAAFRVDFRTYRETTVRRRIMRRMVLHTRESVAEYAEHLKNDRTEVEALYQDILINVTSFFREPEAFEALKICVFPEILASKNPETPIRVWVPGCSTGQEAYSLAITLLEFLEPQPVRPPIQIFATDLSENVSLVKARLGIYPDNIEGEVSPERLRRFFSKEQAAYRINKVVRDLCVFARQNVVADPPFSHLDLISCRNVLIYLTPTLQKRVIPTFHFALNPNGFLLLGGSETVGSFGNLFGAVDSKSHIYAKKAAGLRQYPDFYGGDIHTPEAGEARLPPPSSTKVDWRNAADRALLGVYAPAGVLVNDDLDILQFRGETGRYLAPAPGEPSLNLLKMAREGLLLELRDALNECRRTTKPVHRSGVQIRLEGEIREIDLRVLAVELPGLVERCFLVLFEEPTSPPPSLSRTTDDNQADSLAHRLSRWLWRASSPAMTSTPAGASPDERETDRLRRELAAMRDYLQSVIEQQDAANEELRSANEEILSSNEELQSTNEELETAKEELQSVNEELMTVNDQLQTRNLELTRLSDDMTNLLASAKVPMVVVGVDLRIRRFTPAALKALDLQSTDVGCPIGQRELKVDVSSLRSLISEVIERVQTEEREVRDRDGRWHMLRVRPYWTADNKIDGAVVVLNDIDDAKQAQTSLMESTAYAQSIVETIREPLLILTDDLRVNSANRSFFETFQVKPEETLNHSLYDLGSGQWDIAPLRRLLEELLPGNHTIDKYEADLDFPGIGHRVMLLNARRVSTRVGAPRLILLAFQDVTEQRRAELAQRQSGERFRFLTERMPQIIFTARPDGVVDYFNQQWTELTGLSSETAENRSWMKFVHPADLDETLGVWQHAIETGEPFEQEHRFLRSDGTYRWHLSRANALRDVGGSVLIWTGSSTDIDDQKASQVALKEADQRKDDFLAMLAHELRNPLAALDCGLSLLTGTGHESDRDWALTMAGHQVQLLTRMVDDLLDTSRITRGTFQLRKERVRAAEVIERAVDSVRHLAEAHGLDLQLSSAPESPQLQVDPARLEQIVSNLLNNAIKFTPRGGRIDVTVRPEQTDLVLTVRDTGIGIAGDFLGQVFDPFVQADRSLGRGRGGLGIGLTLVKAVIELHGGSVEARSEGLHKGSQIVIRLPIVEADVPAISASPPVDFRPVQGADAESPCKRILMVEDNHEYALGVRRMLESSGYKVLICSNGQEALSEAPGFAPDVVLLDLGLPGMDGYDVARCMREVEMLARTRIIVISGYASEEDQRHSREVGVDEHLTKPIRFNELLRVIGMPPRPAGT